MSDLTTALRRALDGLAFAAHQAGEQGRALGDCEDVREWIAAALDAPQQEAAPVKDSLRTEP
jgi:hypothetical protein